ncbi:MAG: YbjN domain-containing protein [Aureispira sp.]|nr:YbjN domain-containing protein [Aureispira sp.]
MSYVDKVKEYLLELGHEIIKEIPEDGIMVITNEERGLYHMVLDCEEDVLIIEQAIYEVKKDNPDDYKRLLQMNRSLVHGAFVLNGDASKVIFRDTLELENLDQNELEGSLNALAIALAEYMDELLVFAG